MRWVEVVVGYAQVGLVANVRFGYAGDGSWVAVVVPRDGRPSFTVKGAEEFHAHQFIREFIEGMESRAALAAPP